MKNLLITAKNEIVRLRRENEILRAQVGVVEVFAAVSGLRREPMGMVEDIAWILEREIAHMDYQEEDTGASDKQAQVDGKKEPDVFLPKAALRGEVVGAAGQVRLGSKDPILADVPV